LHYYDTFLVAFARIAPSLVAPFTREGADVTSTKILWRQILIVFGVVLATMWLATRRTA
jgi:hypothetical protein